jgi:hypothetical protein
MSHPAADNPTSPLERDLSLVIEPRWIDADATIDARVGGAHAAVGDAVAKASSLLCAAKSPALVGLSALSIEGVRAAVALAKNAGAKLLPSPAAHPESASRLVTQTASLGNAFASDMVLWVGCRGTDTPITRAIVGNQLLSAFLPAELEAVLDLRRLLRNTRETSPFGAAKKITAVLAADAEPRVVSQWHKLANEVQLRHRIAVLHLPRQGDANARGASEAITWLTGAAPSRGGVDVGAHPPIGCADAQTLLAADAIDVAIDLRAESTAPLSFSPDVKRIVIGESHDDSAAVSFVVPPLSLGVAARVMRFDGVILWLCDDPATAAPDLTAQLLRSLLAK